MTEKLLDNREFNTPAPGVRDSSLRWRGRKVDLPPELQHEALAQLSPEEISNRIKQQGAALGWSVILRQAAGEGDTPAGTQQKAAEFLVQEASRLAAAPPGAGSNEERIKSLSDAELTRLLDMIEAERGPKAPL